MRKALKKLPVNDKDRDKIENIYYQIRVSSPLDKLKAVVCEYDTIRDLLNVDGDGKSTLSKLNINSLEELYLHGQQNSEILLDEKVVDKLEKSTTKTLLMISGLLLTGSIMAKEDLRLRLTCGSESPKQ